MVKYSTVLGRRIRTIVQLSDSQRSHSAVWIPALTLIKTSWTWTRAHGDTGSHAHSPAAPEQKNPCRKPTQMWPPNDLEQWLPDFSCESPGSLQARLARDSTHARGTWALLMSTPHFRAKASPPPARRVLCPLRVFCPCCVSFPSLCLSMCLYLLSYSNHTWITNFTREKSKLI